MGKRALFALLALGAGCFYPAERGRLLEARLDTLAEQQAQLEAALAEERTKLAGTLPKIDAKVAEVERAIDSLDKAARRSGADTGVQVQKAIEDLASLRGQVETYLFKIGELDTALKKVGEDTDRRITELQGAEAIKAAEARRKAEELKRPEDKKQFLALADEKARAGESALSRQLYVEFIKRWAKDELTGDAHFGLGDTYFSEDKCREALSEYGKVIQEFTKARSAPLAYLRSAECFKRLKMKSESRLALTELVRVFPKSDAAKAAKVQLAELDKAKKPPVKKAKP